MIPKLHYGLWMMMICQCRFVSCGKCTILMRIPGNGGGYAPVGVEAYRKSLYLLLCCESKTDLNI